LCATVPRTDFTFRNISAAKLTPKRVQEVNGAQNISKCLYVSMK
jgi:hypothetical protein